MTFKGSPAARAEVKVVYVDPSFLKPVEEPECGCDGIYKELEKLVELVSTTGPIGTTYTDQSGGFSLPLDTTGPFTLIVRGAEGGVAIRPVQVGELRTVAIDLEPGGTASGRVMMEGQPDASTARVTLVSRAGFIATTTPAADGTFSIGPLPASDYWVVARAPGLLADYAHVRSARPIVLELFKPRTIMGAAYRDSTPLVGARVEFGTGTSALATRTSSDGTFQLVGARPGTHELQVSSGELYGSRMVYVSQDSAESPAVHVVVSEARYVGFKVVDETGKPIERVRVQLRGDDWFRRYGVTSHAGLARIGPVPPGTYAAEVYPPRHVEPRSQEARVEQQDVEVKFVLRPAALFQGVVTDADGSPVPQAELMVSRVAESERVQDRTGVGMGNTDGNGAFDIRNLTPGKHRVSVSHPSFVPLDTEVELPTANARLSFTRSVQLRGKVTGAQERPVPFLELLFQGEGAQPTWLRAKTDSDGRFLLVAAEGEYAVTAGRETFYGHSRQPLAVAPQRLTVNATTAGSLSFKVLDQLTISGRVVDASGAPIKNAQVLGRSSEDRPMPDLAITGPDGSFQLQFVPEGVYVLEAAAPGYSRTRLPGVQAGSAGLELRLHLDGLIRGRVVDEKREPVREFVVNFKGMSSVDGRFEVPAKGTGETTLLVRADGFAGARHRVRTVQGAIVDVGDLVLSHGRNLTGVVRDERGQPVSGAAVRIGEGRMAPMEAVKTSATGSFVVARVPLDRTTVIVEDERYLPLEVPLATNQHHLDITVSRGATVLGTFVGESGGPMPGVVVTATNSERESRVVTDADGKFEISGLGSGKWLVQSYIPGTRNPWSDWRMVVLKKNASAELELSEAARATEVRVILESGGRHGRLTLAPGNPPTPTTYAEMRALGPSFFGDDTGGTLRAVQPGSYTLFLWDGTNRLRVARQRIRVERRAVQEVRVKLALP